VTDKKHDFAKSAISKAAFNKDISLATAPSNFKADKPKSKPSVKPETEQEEPEFENPFDEFVKTWQQGDILPFIPPGMTFHLCKYKLNNLDTDAEYLGLDSKYRKKPDAKIKKKSSMSDIDIKNLGPKLRNSVETVRQRALSRRGGLVPWVDDNNKLRCPSGTPAANQFTDEMMSNCFIVSPGTVAGAGRRAIRRAGAAADILSTKPGQRVGVSTVPGDIDVSNEEGIRKLGPSGAQALMSSGGRVGVELGIAGQMGGGFGFRADPKKRSASKAWQLGVKEQLERGRRATYLSDELHKRMINPSAPGGIRLPSGAAVGDIRNKANFMRAMTELFPNVNPDEIESMFDNAMPDNLTYIDKIKFRKSLVAFHEAFIFEAINAPEKAKWMTRIVMDPSLDAAIEIKLEPFAPSITSGNRVASIASQTAAQKAGNLANGGVHFTMAFNPMQMFLASRGVGHTRNGRANGISDSQRGDMHYIAVHEFGHISHFGSVMERLGFDNSTLNRYQMTRTLTRGGGGPPSWNPNQEVGGWIIDWTQAQNPMNSPSIAALIQGAQNLQTRNYKGGNYGRGIYGFTRKDLEKDLSDFYDGLIEAVHNNITDTPDDVAIMRAFAGGEYAALNSIEARAEYFAARRMFGETADNRLKARRRGSLYRARNQGYQANYVEDFAKAWSTGPWNQPGAGGTVLTPRQIYDDMDRIGENISGVKPNRWNISGRMSTSTRPRKSAHAQNVARAVRSTERLSDPNSAQYRRRSISGRMATSGSVKSQNTLMPTYPSLAEPLGIINPEPKEASRSAKILQDASKVNGVTWSNPVPVEEVEKAKDWANSTLVSKFEFHKKSLENGLPELSEYQKDWLQKVIVDAKKELSYEDARTILGDSVNDYASMTSLLREHARLSSDDARVQRIDAFVGTMQSMSKNDFEEMLPSLLSSNTSRADKRVHVMMNNPTLLETAGEYLTIHDKAERDALGIGYTGFAQEGFTADVRKGVETWFGIPSTDDEEVRRLRPASGFLPHADSGQGRMGKLRSEYGPDVQIMHPYAMGYDSSESNGVRKYGTNMVVLRSEVSERTKTLRGDSAADRANNGNVILPVSEMLKPENSVVLHQDTGASLLWDEIVGRGGLNSSNSRQSYNEAVVLGAFNLKDDVEAMVVSPQNFDLDEDELAELPQGINPKSANPLNMPTKLVKAARFRDRMLKENGIDVVVATPYDPVNPYGKEFGLDEVELFNPQMTRQWMGKNFPQANLDEVITDEKTTPYEAFIKHISKGVDPESASGRILASEIERLEEQKLRTYGEAELGRGSLADQIDSRGMELLPSVARRSVSGKMSTQRVTPDEMVEVAEISKRGVAERKQKADAAKTRVANLEEALRILDETGEWKGAELGVSVAMVTDPTLETIDNPNLVPNSKTRAELEASPGGIPAVREKLLSKIDRAKKEEALQQYLADKKKIRVSQNVLDIEDISPEDVEILREEARIIKQMETTDKDAFLSLVGTNKPSEEFAIHAGSAELDGGQLNAAKTEGDEFGGLANNTQALNNTNIQIFTSEREENIAREAASSGLMKKLESMQPFTIDSREERALLIDIGFSEKEMQVGSIFDAQSMFGQNATETMPGYIDRLQKAQNSYRNKIKAGEKVAKALKDNPRGGFLSAYPASRGSFVTRGYFGRWAFKDIPKDVAEIPTDKPFDGQEPSGKTIDQFMETRWRNNLRGTAWLVDGSKNAVVTDVLGPNVERQIVGTTKPVFGLSARKNDANTLDDIGFAVMARAMQLQKEGKEVTPETVLSTSLQRTLSGKMSTGAKPVRPKYPRTPTYGVGIGAGDGLFDKAASWREFKEIYEDREIVFLDYETTGLVFDEFGKSTSNGAPVQIGAVKVKNGKVVARFNVFINPNEKLGEWSRENLKDRDGNPLTDDWLSGQPSIADAHRQLAEFAGPDAIMGVQNASFDKNVLEDALKSSGIEWTPSGYIDTKEISSMVLPRWTPENPDGPAKMGSDGVKRPSNGLKEITEYLGVELGTKHHTADADAEATAEVMQKIIDKAIENGWSDRIFSKSTRQAHIDKVNQKHLQEIEEFKKARDAFLAEVERLATKRDDGSEKDN
jgi:DNA polymerase III epsilon subunit-like protein